MRSNPESAGSLASRKSCGYELDEVCLAILRNSMAAGKVAKRARNGWIEGTIKGEDESMLCESTSPANSAVAVAYPICIEPHRLRPFCRPVGRNQTRVDSG
jgi:hypothetical protein